MASSVHPLPSPTTSASTLTSPRKPSTGMTGRSEPESVRDDGDVLSDNEEEANPLSQDRLEAQRERNRVKQRNLRIRRANHISGLQDQVSSLSAENQSLQTARAAVYKREQHLQSWIRDLETALFQHGLSSEVESLRQIWAAGSTPALAPAMPPIKVELPSGGTDSGQGRALTSSSSSVLEPVPVLQPRIFHPALPSDNHPRPRGPELPHPRHLYTTPAVPCHPMVGGSHTQQQAELSPRKRRRVQDGPLPSPGPSSHSSFALALPLDTRSQARPRSAPATHTLPFASPPSIRIADLLSPEPPRNTGGMGLVSRHSSATLVNPESHHQQSAAFLQLGASGEAGDPGRRWSAAEGEISVIDHFLSYIAPASPPRPYAYTATGHGLDGTHRSAFGVPSPPSHLFPTPDGIFAFQPPTFAFPYEPTSYLFPEDSIPRSVELIKPAAHPSVLAARDVISSLSPPTSSPPTSLPLLDPDQQLTLLSALANLYPPHIQQFYLSRQIKSLPPPYSKSLLTYQTKPCPDPRLLMFPIAVLRANIVSHLDQNLPFDLTAFINATFARARVFGNPLDPEGWEMPEAFWDEWGGWFPPGRSYCASLGGWRRRDGHRGSAVLEMIMGSEGGRARREDPIGWPEGWTPPSGAVKQREAMGERLRRCEAGEYS